MKLTPQFIAGSVLMVASLCNSAQAWAQPTSPTSVPADGNGLSMQSYCDGYGDVAPASKVTKASELAEAHQAIRAVASAANTANAASVKEGQSAVDGPDPEIMAIACRMAQHLKADNNSRLPMGMRRIHHY